MHDGNTKSSLSRRLATLLILVCIPVTIAAGLCLTLIRAKSHSYAVVNFAGTQRTLVERHANYINRTLTSILLNDWENAIESRQQAQEVAAEIEHSLDLLRHGGSVKIPQQDEPLKLLGATDADVIAALDRFASEWSRAKRSALDALRADADNLPTNDGYLHFQNQTFRTFEAMDDAVYHMQHSGERQLTLLGMIIAIAVAITLLCLLGTLYFMRVKVVQPFETATTSVHESEKRLRRITEGTHDGLWEWNLVNNAVWYSHRFWSLLGFPDSGPFPAPVFDSFSVRLHPEDAPLVHEAVQRHLECNEAYDASYRLRTESGDYRWFRARGATDRDEAGKAILMSGSLQDITPRVDAENELRNSESFLRSVLDGQMAHIAILNPDGTIRAANKAWKQFWADNGESNASGFEMNYLSVCECSGGDCSSDANIVARAIRKVLRGESDYETHTYACRGPTSPQWFMVSITPIQGDQQGVVVANYNVTEQIQAQEAAQAANIAKSAFLANMSHEIRTPLTAILGFVETLADSTEKPEDLDAIQTIQRNGDHLLGIINDILDLSKVEAGKMEMESLQANLIEIVAEVEALLRIKADGAGIEFDVVYQGPIPETIRTDPTRLRQILINLLGNAIKFTDAGGVNVEISLSERRDSSFIQFDIRDTGIGMTESQAAKLFQPFTQADGSMTREFGGTGLGLTISKRFAQMLGGDIEIIDTQPGVGSTFRLTVAAGPRDGAALVMDPGQFIADLKRRNVKVSEVDVEIRGVRILLAEDGPDNQRLISHVLTRAGASVRITDNGQRAIDAINDADATDRFDIILMDMQMPVLDGYQATRLLRQQGYRGPIIALTAHAMDSDRATCLDAGCTDYATKPINRKQLIATIARHANLAEAHGS